MVKETFSSDNDYGGKVKEMTHSLGYYTGWAVALVLLFVLPLMVVFIEYLRRVNRQLTDIQSKLTSKRK